ncbi:MAG: FtsW/RodA/SpoVE family cell cycle protein [Clostridium sp.]|uniref:FtsW/RodA/SpoVE family cell cycle protein n=1 Tax=Clostridium sp. TaxID=1506 RepID=UPI003065C5AF
MPTIENSNIYEYVNQVCSLIKNKKVHESVKTELISHIDEIAEEYIHYGLTEDQAIERAISRMGSPSIVGSNLNKVHKATSDWVLIGIASLFILVGIFTLGVIQSNNVTSQGNYTNFLAKTIVYAVGGGILAIGLMKIDYRELKKYSKYLYGSTIILLAYTLFSSDAVNGLIGWMRVGNIAFNTFNIAPFFLIISLAGIFDKWDWRSIKNTLVGFVLAFTPCIFLILGNSSVNLIIYLVGVTTLIILSGVKLTHIITSFGLMGTIFLSYIFSEPYRRWRIFAFANPSLEPNGAGWIYNQLEAVRNSAVFIGRGTNFTSNMLPEIHTDFILSYIVYSFGWIAGIILIALVLAFVIRIVFIGRKTKESYGKLLVSGIGSLFVVQFLFNILVNMTLLPTFAVNMPFISYGGSQLVINILAISIVSNVYKYRNTSYLELS